MILAWCSCLKEVIQCRDVPTCFLWKTKEHILKKVSPVSVHIWSETTLDPSDLNCVEFVCFFKSIEKSLYKVYALHMHFEKRSTNLFHQEIVSFVHLSCTNKSLQNVHLNHLVNYFALYLNFLTFWLYFTALYSKKDGSLKVIYI